MHPMARKGNRTGIFAMRSGDRVICRGKPGVVDEFLQDGDAYVSLDDGSYLTVKWSELQHTLVCPPDVPKPIWEEANERLAHFLVQHGAVSPKMWVSVDEGVHPKKYYIRARLRESEREASIAVSAQPLAVELSRI